MKKFVQIPDEVAKSRKLNPTDKLVYIAIRSYMNARTKTCFPSRQQICDSHGVNPRSITGAIAKIKKEGFITVVHRKDATNLYIFQE